MVPPLSFLLNKTKKKRNQVEQQQHTSEGMFVTSAVISRLTSIEMLLLSLFFFCVALFGLFVCFFFIFLISSGCWMHPWVRARPHWPQLAELSAAQRSPSHAYEWGGTKIRHKHRRKWAGSQCISLVCCQCISQSQIAINGGGEEVTSRLSLYLLIFQFESVNVFFFVCFFLNIDLLF